MFMDYVAHRAHRRRINIASAVALSAGFVFSTLIALVGLASAAAAATPTAAVDVSALATMLAAPQLHAAPAMAREVLLALMSAGLVAMSAGSLVFWRGLERGWQTETPRRR